MGSDKIVFGGTEYSDGSASDPRALKFMHGSPPPASKRIRMEDDRYLVFPEFRWSLSHTQEMLPTVSVWRGSGPSGEFRVGVGGIG